MKFISDSQVSEAILSNSSEFLNHLKVRVEEIANGHPAWIKPKIIYPDPIHPEAGDIRPMTCFTEHVKVVKVISTNPIRKKHWSVSVGSTLLLDYEENYPIAIFDAPAMSALRTAGLAAIGIEFAGYGFDDVGVIGTGRVGTNFIQLISEAYGIKNVSTYDIKDSSQRDPKFDSKVVVTATNSREPFLFTDNCQAEFVVSVGADTHFNHELEKAFITSRGGLYVDVMDALNVGDLSELKEAKELVQGDLFDLCKNGRGNARSLVSVGSPLMDALTVEFLTKKI